MQILLNQTEIESALKDYVAKQGIKLQGRTVEIEFTSGRKENGVSADMRISDDANDFPVFTSEEVQAGATGSVVGSISPAEDPSFNASVPQKSVLTSEEEQSSEPAKPTNLFGN